MEDPPPAFPPVAAELRHIMRMNAAFQGGGSSSFSGAETGGWIIAALYSSSGLCRRARLGRDFPIFLKRRRRKRKNSQWRLDEDDDEDEDALTTLLLIGPLTRTAKEKKRLHDAGGGDPRVGGQRPCLAKPGHCKQISTADFKGPL